MGLIEIDPAMRIKIADHLEVVDCGDVCGSALMSLQSI